MPELLPRGFTRRDTPAILLTAISVLLGFALFRFFMVPYSTQVNFDEGSEAAAVERIIDGRWLPYVDVESIRGPFLYWTQGILHVLTGRFEFTGTRLLAMFGALITIVMTFLAGWAADLALAGAIGGAFYLFVIATYTAPGGGMGVVGESVAIAYLTTAFFFVSYGLYRARSEKRRALLLALGGCFVAVAALTKQTIAATCAPIFLWISMRALGEADSASPSLPGTLRFKAIFRQYLLPFAAGGLGLLLLVLLRYLIAGELVTFLFWSTGFGAKFYMAPFQGRVSELMAQWFVGEPWAILGVCLALIVALARPLAALGSGVHTVRSARAAFGHAAFELGVGLTSVAALAAALFPLRNWPHYFMPIYPFFGLTLGIVIERTLRRGPIVPQLAQYVAVAVLGGLLLMSGLNRLSSLNSERRHGGWANPRPDPACAAIDRAAGAGNDPIFIWGTAGDLYITCKRPSVSMFTSTMIIAGLIPPSWTPDPKRVAPGIQEKLLEELETTRPRVVLDHAMAERATMRDFPIYAKFLDDQYCRVPGTVRDNRGIVLTLYARKDLALCKTGAP
ncbi:MAG TPA: hypothetical protein VGC79_19710 [Polyangiaceae bacterium]